MIKKFNPWQKTNDSMIKKDRTCRDKLSFKQVKIIMWIVGIVVAILLATAMWVFMFKDVANKETPETAISPEKATIMLAIVCIVYGILGGMLFGFITFVGLNGVGKKVNHIRNAIKSQITSKLKYDQYTQVYLKSRAFQNVPQVVVDGYNMHDIKYFAIKKGDSIHLHQTIESKIINEYTIDDWEYFDKYFRI